MKSTLTAAAFATACAVGLAAQSTTGTSGTAQDPQSAAGGRGGGPRTVTGCLRAGDTAGTYTLTNVEGLGGGRRGDGTTAGGTTTGATTTGATTTGSTTTASGTTAGAATAGQGRGPMTLMLTPESSVDLKPHVGHKIEVTGTLAGGRGQGADTTTSTATGTGTTTGGGTTTGTTTGTGTTGGQGRGMRSMTVTSLKMVSDSCS